MHLRNQTISTVVVALFLTLVLAEKAYSAEGVVGYLKCNVASGWGFVFASSKDLKCVYSPANGHSKVGYTGRIHKFGLDIGYTNAGVILWSVVAPRINMARGALTGTYVGVSVEVTAGLGVGANALVGGGNSISLQPVSISGQTGLNAAVGIGSIELRVVN